MTMEHAPSQPVQGEPEWWGTEGSHEQTEADLAEYLAAGAPDGGLGYHKWRRTRGHRLYVADVDQIEWRDPTEGPMKGKPLPAAVVELTAPKAKGYPGPGWKPHHNYLAAILHRYRRDGPHGCGYRLAYVAGQLRVPGYILLHDREDPPQHLYRYQWCAPPEAAPPSGLWTWLTLDQHEAWLLALQPVKLGRG
jgi:hypothetical protein